MVNRYEQMLEDVQDCIKNGGHTFKYYGTTVDKQERLKYKMYKDGKIEAIPYRIVNDAYICTKCGYTKVEPHNKQE